MTFYQAKPTHDLIGRMWIASPGLKPGKRNCEIGCSGHMSTLFGTVSFQEKQFTDVSKALSRYHQQAITTLSQENKQIQGRKLYSYEAQSDESLSCFLSGTHGIFCPDVPSLRTVPYLDSCTGNFGTASTFSCHSSRFGRGMWRLDFLRLWTQTVYRQRSRPLLLRYYLWFRKL